MKHHKRNPWLTDETFCIICARSAARLAGDMNRVRQLHSIFRSKARADKEAYLNGIADGVQEVHRTNNLAGVYKAMKLPSSSHPHRNVMAVHKENRQPTPTE